MVGLQELRGSVAESDHQDEDDQPEELTLVSGREEAESRRTAEQTSRKRVAAEAKQKRRKWSQKAKEKPEDEPKEAVASSGLLQEDVLRYLAAREERSIAAQPEPSEQEDLAPEVIDKKKRRIAKKLDEQSNRVQIVLLDQDLGKGGVAQSGRDFRHERLFGCHVRRSVGMLSNIR